MLCVFFYALDNVLLSFALELRHKTVGCDRDLKLLRSACLKVFSEIEM
jgi:hypothetical protein